MDDSSNRPENLIDTTDCLEAIGAFKCWKNFFFLLILFSLFLIQAGFWLVNLDVIQIKGYEQQSAANVEQPGQTHGQTADSNDIETAADEQTRIAQAAKQVIGDVNEPTSDQQVQTDQAAPEQQPDEDKFSLPFEVELSYFQRPLEFVNFVLIMSSLLYCLTLMFCIKVSLLGRLGGINHISRAFFYSLILVALVLPWQSYFGPVLTGMTFSAQKLLTAKSSLIADNISSQGMYYLRFVGYWLIVFIFAIIAQARSSRWSRATLKRLEVI